MRAAPTLIAARLAALLTCTLVAAAPAAGDLAATGDAPAAGDVTAPEPHAAESHAAGSIDGSVDGSVEHSVEQVDGDGRVRRQRDRRLGFGFAAGYGHGTEIRSRQKGRDVGDVQILALLPQLHVPLVALGNGSSWIHGDLDAVFELPVLVNFTPTTGYSAGATLSLRYLFRPDARVRPYIEGGGGVGYLGFDLASQANGFSFYLQGGGGLRFSLGERLSLTTSIRWHHISNAQIQQPNNGIDDFQFLLGLERR